MNPGDHPPWRWAFAAGSWALVDAAEQTLMEVEAHVEPSPRVRALTEAAPKMAALLRHIAFEVLPGEYCQIGVATTGIAEAATALLDEISDAERRA